MAEECELAEAALDDVFVDDIIVPASRRLSAGRDAVPAPRRQAHHAVLINSATAVPRKIYRGFATYLAGAAAWS